MIELATIDDVLYVARNMREDDMREVVADSRIRTPEAIAAVCMMLPCTVYVAKDRDGTPVAVGGVARNEPLFAQAWLFGTKHISRCKLEIAKLVHSLTADAVRDGLTVQARSAAFHTQAHKWLRVLGFRQVAVLENYGMSGEDFVVFRQGE